VAAIAQSVTAAGLDAKIVALPGLPSKGDVLDWLKQGHTGDELAALVTATKRYEPSAPSITVATHAEDILSEAGAAERLARRCGQDLRFDHHRNRWLIWHGHHWKADPDHAVVRLVLGFVREWQREGIELPNREKSKATIDFAFRLERRGTLDAILSLARAMKPIADIGVEWDRQQRLLGAPNGVVELETGTLRPGRREDRITMSTGIEYDPQARSARWEDALRAILPDPDMREFLQTAIGYSATGDTSQDVWFLGQGSGRNGKGTIFHPVRRALGDYAAELPASVFDARRESAPYDLAILPGKRFVVSSECGDTIKIHHDRIKQISGGDPMRAANKYEKSFEFQPVCKLWLSANRKPRVTDDSPAFWARVMLLPFTTSFLGREDRTLRPALEHDPEHQAAVLAWIVQGAVRYYDRGLEAPETVRGATAAYQEDCDPLSEFVADAIDIVPGSQVTFAELYEHYQRWGKRHGMPERELLGTRSFGERMGTRFEKDRDTRTGRTVYLGLARRPEGSEE
jgi:putative DNA primase/helicase